MLQKNPIAVRSKQMITCALLELMQIKSYAKITVSEIVDKAQVVRKTFYRNFTSKDEVLDEYVETLFSQYIEQLSNLTPFTAYNAVLTYFVFWNKNIAFLNILIQNNLSHIVLEAYEKYLPTIDKEYQQSELSQSKYYDYTVAFSAGGFWRLLCVWAKKGALESPEEMADYYTNSCC